MDTSTFNTEASNLSAIYLRLISPLPASQFSPTNLQQMIDKELKGLLQPDLENGINTMRRKLHEWQLYDEDVKQILKGMKHEIQEILNIQRGTTRKQEELSDIITKVEEKLLEIKEQLDSPNKEGITFIDKMKQTRKIVLSQMVLEQHRSHAKKNFVETQGYRTGNEILQQHRRLILTGKSGQGKTYLAYQLLKTTITDNSNIKPLMISTVEEWRSMVDSSLTLGIIVDDMCGKFGLNEGELIQWQEESKSMSALIENGKHVVIFTIKSHLYEKVLVALQYKSNVSGLLFSKEINLNLDNISLQLTEKTEFANKYLTEFGLNKKKVSKLCSIHEASVGFPQLCRAAVIIKEKSKLFDFFSNPREIILEQIENFRLVDRMIYGCLVLVMLSEGQLDLQSIREFEASNENKENKVKSVFRSCGVHDMTSITVTKTLKSLQSTYVSLDATDESYSFSHDSIEEAVFISYGELFPKETLLYSSLEVICKRCTIKYESKVPEITANENKLSVQPSYQPVLINRFITALKESNPKDFAIISEANVWSCKDFRKAFIAECKEIHYLADKEENSLLVHAAKANNRDLVDHLLQELDQVPLHKKKQVDQFLTKSAKASCVHKATYLLNKLCTVGGVHANDILPSSVEQGSITAIEFLLQSGANVYFRSENGENLLHRACLKGQLDMTKYLVETYPNMLNEVDSKNQTAAHFAAKGGNVAVLSYLIDRSTDPWCRTSQKQTLLHRACLKGQLDMTKYLVETYPNMLNEVDSKNQTASHFAAEGGNVAVLSYLTDRSTDP